ncbi:MAG: carbon monoxide dehydrogenase subunit G [Burkholderiales bacterium]|nr:carbon monoxide dehydrogenase subunit G [Burkholderiales bacterium]
MDMNDSRVIRAPRDKVWVALNDPAVLKQCVFGCESLDRQDDGSLAAAMAVRVGPVAAKFKGKLRMEDVVAPERYTLVFEGNGGAAGFAKGTAKVALSDAEGGGTRLEYSASSQVGGKLAQVGSRLIDAAAKKIADDFFAKFDSLVASVAPAVPGDVAIEGGAYRAGGIGQSSGGVNPLWIAAGVVALAVLAWLLLR